MTGNGREDHRFLYPDHQERNLVARKAQRKAKPKRVVKAVRRAAPRRAKPVRKVARPKKSVLRTVARPAKRAFRNRFAKFYWLHRDDFNARRKRMYDARKRSK